MTATQLRNDIRSTTERTALTGELTLGEMAQFRRQLANDPELRRQAEEYTSEWASWEDTNNTWALDANRARLDVQLMGQRVEDTNRQTRELLESMGIDPSAHGF